MEIKDSNDHRFYMSEYGIATIQLGTGDVIVSDLSFKNENYAGVGFSLGSGEVGEHHADLDGKGAVEAGVFFQVIATKPESLQVVIDKLLKAKADLESKVIDA